MRKLNDAQDRDEFGASGTYEDGVFQPYPGAETKRQRAEATAKRQVEERNARRSELDALTVEQIKAEYPGVDFSGLTKKADIIDKALDG